MANPLMPKRQPPVKIINLPKSAGILDDYAVRKNVATREGTIEKVPVNDSDIVNKKYVDDEVSNYVPYTGATSDVNLGNKNLTTTGDIQATSFTVDGSTNDFEITGTNTLMFQNLMSGQFRIDQFTKDGDGGDNLNYRMWNKGTPADVSNGEFFQLLISTSGYYGLFNGKNGTGSLKTIKIDATGTQGSQIYLATDGKVGISRTPTTYSFEVQGDIYATGNLRGYDVVASNGVSAGYGGVSTSGTVSGVIGSFGSVTSGTGASGSFTTADGKTVTVTSGIITSIV